jgi:CheY-like chemotaxis protein
VSHAGASSPPSTDRRVLVLVVERNPIVQRLERFFLEQAGYAVEFASDGLSALARAKELRPAIVISEVLVPKMDGLTLCRTLKSDPAMRAIIVLLFSHLSAEDRAIEAGADAFLNKPVDDRSLVETLGKLVAKHEDCLRRDP